MQHCWCFLLRWNSLPNRNHFCSARTKITGAIALSSSDRHFSLAGFNSTEQDLCAPHPSQSHYKCQQSFRPVTNKHPNQSMERHGHVDSANCFPVPWQFLISSITYKQCLSHNLLSLTHWINIAHICSVELHYKLSCSMCSKHCDCLFVRTQYGRSEIITAFSGPTLRLCWKVMMVPCNDGSNNQRGQIPMGQ